MCQFHISKYAIHSRHPTPLRSLLKLEGQCDEWEKRNRNRALFRSLLLCDSEMSNKATDCCKICVKSCPNLYHGSFTQTGVFYTSNKMSQSWQLVVQRILDPINLGQSYGLRKLLQ